jgi:hypothetical protein
MPSRRSSSDSIVWKEVEVEIAIVGEDGGAGARFASISARGLYGAGGRLRSVGASEPSAVGQVDH